MVMNNYSSTPPGYMTPEQIQQQYDYSQLLTKGGMRDEHISSPWQGARMMADALSGGLMRNRTGQQQAGNTFGAGRQVAAIQGAGAPPSPPPGVPAPMPPSSPPPTQGAASAPPPIMPTSPLGGNNPTPGSGGGSIFPYPAGGKPPQIMGMGQDPMMMALMSQPPGAGMQG